MVSPYAEILPKTQEGIGFVCFFVARFQSIVHSPWSMVQNLPIGQFFFIRFDGVTPPATVAEFIREKNIGGVTLFASNCPGVKETAESIHRLKNSAGRFPLCVSVDHEGGQVHRLPKPVTHFPPLRTLGKLCERMPSSNLVWETGRVMGRELKALGFDLNFAPVADVDTNPFNPVIGDRAFSNNAEVVAMAATQLIEGMQGVGVAACAKHFPGHGDTNEDSHAVLPRLPHNLKRLHSLELIPFKAAIQKNVAAIMPAHVVYNGMDHGLPATFSVKLLRDLLREELGFEDLIISDDLSMGAISKNSSMEEACVKAFAAGCDVLLTFGSIEKVRSAIDYFSQAVDEGKIPAERIEKSLQRIAEFKARFCKKTGDSKPDLKSIGSREHQDILSKINQLQ